MNNSSKIIAAISSIVFNGNPLYVMSNRTYARVVGVMVSNGDIGFIVNKINGDTGQYLTDIDSLIDSFNKGIKDRILYVEGHESIIDCLKLTDIDDEINLMPKIAKSKL